MPTIPELARFMAKRLGIDESRLVQQARRLREDGLLEQKGYGRGAAQADSKAAATLLICAMSAERTVDAVPKTNAAAYLVLSNDCYHAQEWPEWLGLEKGIPFLEFITRMFEDPLVKLSKFGYRFETPRLGAIEVRRDCRKAFVTTSVGQLKFVAHNIKFDFGGDAIIPKTIDGELPETRRELLELSAYVHEDIFDFTRRFLDGDTSKLPDFADEASPRETTPPETTETNT